MIDVKAIRNAAAAPELISFEKRLVIEILDRLALAEEALSKIAAYRSDKPDWNMVMAIAEDYIDPKFAEPS